MMSSGDPAESTNLKMVKRKDAYTILGSTIKTIQKFGKGESTSKAI